MKFNDCKLLIGTSGWMYNHWKKIFYPENVSNENMLKYYAGRFTTVEVNNTFYKVPTIKTIQNWANNTPDRFKFVIKANQFITHRKYLKDGKENVNNFLNIIKILDQKLGPILFQLPPNWKINFERIKEFVENLPKDYLYTFEMRNPSWYVQDVFDLFKKHNIALCIHDFYDEIAPEKITANFTYLRFHGPKGPYFGKYSPDQLDQWAKKIHEWIQQDIGVFVYFNNDAYGWAIENALELKNLLNKYE